MQESTSDATAAARQRLQQHQHRTPVNTNTATAHESHERLAQQSGTVNRPQSPGQNVQQIMPQSHHHPSDSQRPCSECSPDYFPQSAVGPELSVNELVAILQTTSQRHVPREAHTHVVLSDHSTHDRSIHTHSSLYIHTQYTESACRMACSSVPFIKNPEPNWGIKIEMFCCNMACLKCCMDVCSRHNLIKWVPLLIISLFMNTNLYDKDTNTIGCVTN
jgi:hypothetical protein